MSQHIPSDNRWTFVRAVKTSHGQVDIFKKAGV
jgi:hypothetical protein